MVRAWCSTVALSRMHIYYILFSDLLDWDSLIIYDDVVVHQSGIIFTQDGYYNIIVNYLLHPVQARDLINQLAKKLISSLAISPMACVKERSEEQNLLPPWRWLLLYLLLNQAAYSYLQPTTCKCTLSPVFLYSLSKKLEFAPISSAITAVYRDRLILASYVRWPGVQPLVSRWSNHFRWPPVTDRQTDGQI